MYIPTWFLVTAVIVYVGYRIAAWRWRLYIKAFEARHRRAAEIRLASEGKMDHLLRDLNSLQIAIDWMATMPQPELDDVGRTEWGSVNDPLEETLLERNQLWLAMAQLCIEAQLIATRRHATQGKQAK